MGKSLTDASSGVWEIIRRFQEMTPEELDISNAEMLKHWREEQAAKDTYFAGSPGWEAWARERELT